MLRLLWIWAPAIVQMAAIFVLSGIPNLDALPGGIPDHPAHFAGYALLGALVIRGLASARWAGVSAGVACRAWLISAAYGVTDEYHQSFVTGRSPSVGDWIADAFGAAVAIGVIAVWARRSRIAKGREV